MKTLIIDKSDGRILSVWNGLMPDGYKTDYCHHVDVADDHELVAIDEDGLPIPAKDRFPRWSDKLTKTQLEKLTEREICELAAARGYKGVVAGSKTKAENIEAFLDQQNA